jgi:predicted NBD/HSP70 family sugar kinase
MAGLVNAFNPSIIVVGGDLAAADEQLFAGLREVVYRRSTALATRHLQVARSSLDDHAGVIGGAVMAIEHVLSPQAVDQRVLNDGFA